MPKRHIFADLYRPVAYKVSRLLEVKSRIWVTLLIAHLLSQSLMRQILIKYCLKRCLRQNGETSFLTDLAL